MTAAVPTPLTLRVTFADTWAPLALEVAPSETVAQLKARALAAIRVDSSRAEEYEVKLGGARVADESRTFAALGVGSGTALIVLARRRRPVR